MGILAKAPRVVSANNVWRHFTRQNHSQKHLFIYSYKKITGNLSLRMMIFHRNYQNFLKWTIFYC